MPPRSPAPPPGPSKPARPRRHRPARREGGEGGGWAEAIASCPHCGIRPTAVHPRPPPSPAAQGLTRHQEGQEHDEHSHGSAAAAAVQGDTELAGGTPATTAARVVDELGLAPTPYARPVLASSGTAAAFSTNRQLRRGLRKRRSPGNVSVTGGA